MKLSDIPVLMFFLFVILSAEADAAVYKIKGDVIGEVHHYTTTEEDNLYEIARRFDLGIVELLAANPDVDVWMPEAGTVLDLPTMHVLPAHRKGIVINLAELRLFYYPGDGSVFTFPVGIGREGWQTPTGKTNIILKRENPVWIPPESLKEENPDLPDMFPAGPDNPLGLFALNLGWKNFRIHGTNRPHGVGKRSSHGCIRLYPEDIEMLFGMVSVGTPVTIIDMPYKTGFHNNLLYLEVTPTQQQSDNIANYDVPEDVSITDVYEAITLKLPAAQLDIFAIEKAIEDHDGLPVVIGVRPERRAKRL